MLIDSHQEEPSMWELEIPSGNKDIFLPFWLFSAGRQGHGDMKFFCSSVPVSLCQLPGYRSCYHFPGSKHQFCVLGDIYGSVGFLMSGIQPWQLYHLHLNCFSDGAFILMVGAPLAGKFSWFGNYSWFPRLNCTSPTLPMILWALKSLSK